MKRISRKERDCIITELCAGKSQNAVAKAVGRSPSTVCRIAKQTGVEYSAPKRANSARRTYAKSARLELSDLLFRRVEALARICETPKQIRELSTAFAILLDKRLLECGGVTERIERRVTGHEAKARIASLIASANDKD